jgi:DNA primase small subunit
VELTAETFGFKHLLWVYSGRRGIHCWVSDTLAVDLTDDQRRALVTFLEVIKGSKEQAKKVNVRGGRDDTPLHPYLADALETLKYEFTKLCLLDQDVFKAERGWKALLALVPSDRGELNGTRKQLTADKTEKLRGLWEAEPDRPSEQKWKDVMDIVHTYKRSKNPMGRKWDAALEDLILQYTYPRIDAEVSKHRNHLLKAPFCVHPGTGRVCVPVDPAKVELFDPDTVPTVGELLVELDRAPPSDSEGKGEPSTMRNLAHNRL